MVNENGRLALRADRFSKPKYLHTTLLPLLL